MYAPDLEAFLCKQHAESGGSFTIDYVPRMGGIVEVTVTSGGQTISQREIEIRKSAS